MKREMKYDLLVIGAGPAGYYCAVNGALKGLRTAIIEKEELGGTGLRWGCLPVKKILDQIRMVVDLENLMISNKMKNNVIKKTYKNVYFKALDELKSIEGNIENSFKDKGIDIYYGDGEFKDENTYITHDYILMGQNIVIATGTSPVGIGNIQVDRDIVITHKEAITLKELPKKMIIIGGNVEGTEFASLFSNLGVEITIVEMEDDILKGNDRDIVEPLEDTLVSKGVTILKGVGAQGVELVNNGGRVFLDNNSFIEGDKVLVTGFRKPNFPNGLEGIGVNVEDGKIIVDRNLKTTIPNIYAIGDINGILGMAHVAIQQGILVVENIISCKDITQNYEALPRAIFTIPEIAGVGAQEWELREKNINYRVEKSYLRDTWRGFSKEIDEGFVKIIVNEKNQILGLWMWGRNVSEVIGSFGYLIDNKVKLDDIKENLFIHPTLSEGILDTVIKLG